MKFYMQIATYEMQGLKFNGYVDLEEAIDRLFAHGTSQKTVGKIIAEAFGYDYSEDNIQVTEWEVNECDPWSIHLTLVSTED